MKIEELARIEDQSMSQQFSPLPVESCVYRGEGNANVVVSLPQEGCVIRFRKSLPGERSQDGGERHVRRQREFVVMLIEKFLGPYARPPEILRFRPEDVARLSAVIRPQRPEKRCDKDLVDEYAVKLPDYVFLESQASLEADPSQNKSTYCVEIKPKQGYYDSVEYRYRKCSYCLTQYHKLKKETIKKKSNFCPLDLFSGDKESMISAIKALLDSPQNNLNIIKDGIIVYDQHSNAEDLRIVLEEWFPAGEPAYGLEKFCSLVRAALLRPINQVNSEIIWINRRKISDSKRENGNTDVEKCRFVNGDLPRNSVLERVYNMQKVSYVSTSAAAAAYVKYADRIDDDAVYEDLGRKFGRSAVKKICNDNNALDKIDADSLAIVRNYLLFCTAKDCSILMAFRETNQLLAADDNILSFSDGSQYRYNVAVADLDPKSVNRIESHVKRDLDVIGSALERIDHDLIFKKF